MEMKQSENSQPRIPGELDRTFATDGRIEINEDGAADSITSEKDGKLILASRIDSYFRLSRYLVDGAKDDSFQETTWNFEEGDTSRPTRVLLQEDGKILVVGYSFSRNVMRPAVTRFHPNGTPDLVFGRRVITTGPANSHMSLLLSKTVDGCLHKGQKILISACYTLDSEVPFSRLFCLQSNGETDTDFGQGRGFIDIALHDQDSYVKDVQIQSSGSIVVAGSWRHVEHYGIRTVARYTTQGVLDTTFGQSGYADIVVPNENTVPDFSGDIVGRVVVQKDDKILIAGYSVGRNGRRDALLARLDQDGIPDIGFNGGKPALISRSAEDLFLHSLTIKPDGNIVVVGTGLIGYTTMEVYQGISSTGEIEDGWFTNSIGSCADVTIQPTGRVIISGSYGPHLDGPRAPMVWGRLGA
jgi:uncharacterized delta-60 repeat protein